MKKFKLPIITVSLLLQLPVLAQIKVDHSIQLTGSGANARVSGVHAVMDSADAASAAAIQNGSLVYATAIGSSNNFDITINPPIAAYQKGMVFNFISNQNITGPATLNVNNLGNIYITKYINQNLSQCDIQDGQFVTVAYDGMDFQMISAPVNINMPGVSITATADTFGQGTSVTFTATPVNGGTSPTYQWTVNGGNVGAGGTTYTTSTLNNGNVVACIMTASSATCGSPATSNSITVNVINTLVNDLFAYWKMDELSGNPADASGNGHTLTNYNGCPFGTAYGVINNGVSLNGSNQYLYCSDAGFPAGNSDRTFAYWVNFTSTPTNGAAMVFYGTSADHEVVSVQWVNAGINIDGYFDDGDFTPGFLNGTWYHVAFTISNSGSDITLYINGTLFSSSTGHAWNTVPGGTFYIGYRPDINVYSPFNMDEVGVWSRALSATEIADLYNGGVGLQYPF